MWGVGVGIVGSVGVGSVGVGAPQFFQPVDLKLEGDSIRMVVDVLWACVDVCCKVPFIAY